MSGLSPLRLRQTLARQLMAEIATRPGLSPINRAILVAILASIVLVVLESEPTLSDVHGALFTFLDRAFALLFAIEYAARVWVAGEVPRYAGLQGRLRYMASPMALLDLVALLPFLLAFGSNDLYVLRSIRVLRIISVVKVGRYSRALRLVMAAFAQRRYELAVGLGIASFALLIASTLLYIAEGTAQPEAFGSIPRALWWGISTITTVGYGDVYPITAIGRIFAAMSAVAGVALVALPTAILAAAFSEALAQERARREHAKSDRDS